MQDNKERITREFCEGKTLLFYPKTTEEAEFIQRRLFEMGYKWCRDKGTQIDFQESCIAGGMVLDANGVLWTYPDKSYLDAGLRCDISQFDKKYLSPDQAFMLEQFNKLAARVEQVVAMVEELRAEIMPKKIDKPALKKTQPGSGL